MNAEVIKIMNKKEKKQNFRKWWRKNGYKVLRVVLFPIWIGEIIQEKIKAYLYSREVWSEERVKEILDYYIPHTSDWDANDKDLYFFNNGYGWSIHFAKKYLKRKDRRWWKKHCGWSGGDIRRYLIDKYELEGFTKEVRDCNGSWTEILFKMKEEI